MTITQKKQLIPLLTFACTFAGTTLLAGSNVLLAAAFSLTKYTVSPLALNFPAIQGAPANNNEIPPAIIKDKSNNYFVSGYMSFSCLGNWGLFDSGIHAFAGCSEVLGPVVDNIQTGYIIESMADALPAYKRNFNGIFSVVEYNNPASSNGLSLLAVMHEENKGEVKPYAGGGVGSFRSPISSTEIAVPAASMKTMDVTSPLFPLQRSPIQRKPAMVIIRNGPIMVPSWPSQGYIIRWYNKSCEWSATSPCDHRGELCLCILPGFLLHKWFGRPIQFRCGRSPWWHESDSSPPPQCSARELVCLLSTGCI